MNRRGAPQNSERDAGTFQRGTDPGHIQPRDSGLQRSAVKKLDDMLNAELRLNPNISKILAKSEDLNGASGESRTHDRRFTNYQETMMDYNLR
jgi:hypothetical protein